MKKLLDFLKTNLHSIIWTICYFFIVWLVMLWMFNFDIFSVAQWHILAHAKLRGFPGFVFGLMLLATLPLYIATTVLIYRNKKPLFTIPLSKFFGPVPIESEQQKQAPQEIAETQEEVPETKPFPAEMPAELHAAFIKARSNLEFKPIKSNFDISNVISTGGAQPPQNENEQESEANIFPLPSDFDFDDSQKETSYESAFPNFTPVFQDINFDDEPEEETPQEKLLNLLISEGKSAKIEDNLVLTDKSVIAVHDDSDFWIADEDAWFASGKQKKSPILNVLEKSKQLNLQPVLYLAQTNIMDLESRKQDWEKQGIKIVFDIKDL